MCQIKICIHISTLLNFREGLIAVMWSAMSPGSHWFLTEVTCPGLCLIPPNSYTCIGGWEQGKKGEGKERGVGSEQEGEDYSEVQLY